MSDLAEIIVITKVNGDEPTVVAHGIVTAHDVAEIVEEIKRVSMDA